jgi:hypothetical protein
VADATSEQPGWTGAGGTADAAWNTVQLGDIILPGICTVTGFDAGQDVDVKKQKGSDGATLEDNGKDPAEGKIEVQINEALWPAWQKIIPRIHPRTPGASRAPREILHPKPNVLGIRDVYVRKIGIEGPTARGGMKIVLDVIEWFPKPKAVKKAAGKPATQATGTSQSMYFDDAASLRAWELAQASNSASSNSLSGFSDADTLRDNTFPSVQRSGISG